MILLLLMCSLILSEFDNNRQINVHVGDTITIKLPSQGWKPSWVDPNLLQLVGTTVEKSPNGVRQVFTFRVVGTGATLLDIHYTGQPGPNAPVSSLFRINVHAN